MHVQANRVLFTGNVYKLNIHEENSKQASKSAVAKPRSRKLIQNRKKKQRQYRLGRAKHEISSLSFILTVMSRNLSVREQVLK